MSAATSLPAPFSGEVLTPLPAPAPGCALWLCRLDHDSRPIDAIAGSLSAAEHSRAARFGTDLLRHRWMVGRATLRSLLGAALRIDPSAVELRAGRRGRPQLAARGGLDFNVSHTQGIALFVLADGLPSGARVGVDVEHAGRAVNADRLARKFLGERERAALAPLDADSRRQRFLRLWTCKEAMSKATGDALSAPFREIEVALGEAPKLVAGPAPYLPHCWRLIAARTPAELMATVAIWQPA